MALVTDLLLVDVLLGVAALWGFLYWYWITIHTYWDKRRVPNVKTGNFIKFMLGRLSQADASLDQYNRFRKEKYSGVFHGKKPILVVRDPILINKILVKDFVHFQDRGVPMFKNDVLLENLFNLRGQLWRALRYKLTPTFSTGKLRTMFEQVSKSSDNMMNKIEELREKYNEIECKSFLFVFTLDIITSCAFGLQIKPNSTDFHTFKSTVQKLFTGSLTTMLKYTVLMLCPKLSDILSLKTFPRKTVDYFLKMTYENIKYRKDNNIDRNDYFQLLLTLKEQEDSGREHLAPSDIVEDDTVIDQMRYTEQSGLSPIPNVKCKYNFMHKVN